GQGFATLQGPACANRCELNRFRSVLKSRFNDKREALTIRMMFSCDHGIAPHFGVEIQKRELERWSDEWAACAPKRMRKRGLYERRNFDLELRPGNRHEIRTGTR